MRLRPKRGSVWKRKERRVQFSEVILHCPGKGSLQACRCNLFKNREACYLLDGDNHDIPFWNLEANAINALAENKG